MTAPIGSYNPPPPPPPGPPMASAPSSGRAMAALILGILGFICCFPAGVAAIIVGKMELNAIDQGRSAESNRGLAKAGYILGIVSVVLSCLSGITFLVLNIMGVALFGNMPTERYF